MFSRFYKNLSIFEFFWYSVDKLCAESIWHVNVTGPRWRAVNSLRFFLEDLSNYSTVIGVVIVRIMLRVVWGGSFCLRGHGRMYHIYRGHIFRLRDSKCLLLGWSWWVTPIIVLLYPGCYVWLVRYVLQLWWSLEWNWKPEVVRASIRFTWHVGCDR